jgi:transcriptional regulator with XRE-family HTH domain
MARRVCGREWRAADAAALGPPAPEPPPAPSDVTRLVRHARRQARLSQRGLAARAGVAQSTVAEIEMGRVDPKAGTLARLLAACNCRLTVAPVGDVPEPPAAPAAAPVTAHSSDRSAAAALARRLDREPAGRIADAGPAVVSLVDRIIRDAAERGTEPIVIGDLAELIWGADRNPSTAQLCVRPAESAAMACADPRGSPPYDVQVAPAGTHGWADLRRAAAPVRIGFRRLLVASLDDLIRIRRSALSEEDQARLADLECLVATIEETERREAAGNPRFPAHWDVRPLAHLDWLLLRGRVRDVDRTRRQRTLTGFCS